MKILHRINLNVVGGVEHQFCQFLAHPLAADGFVHEVLVGEPPHPRLWDDIQSRVSAVQSFKRRGAWRLPRWPARLREANLARLVADSKADVLLSWSAFARADLARACARAQLPLVHREGGGAWFNRSPCAAAEYIAQLSGAICNTRASQRMLQLKWGYQGPARVCLGGLRPDLLVQADGPATRAERARWRMGTAARLAVEKGVCLAIHALHALVRDGLDCELAIAGEGPERQRLQRLAAELGIEDRVDFRGRVDDIAGFYRSLDLLVHPALREPLGNVVIEAAAFGVPVVATRVDGLAETVENGVTGITVVATEPLAAYAGYGGGDANLLPNRVYDPDADTLRPVRFARPAALAEAVSDIAADQRRCAQMGTAAAAFVRQRFGFERYMAEFMQAVRQFAH